MQNPSQLQLQTQSTDSEVIKQIGIFQQCWMVELFYTDFYNLLTNCYAKYIYIQYTYMLCSWHTSGVSSLPHLAWVLLFESWCLLQEESEGVSKLRSNPSLAVLAWINDLPAIKRQRQRNVNSIEDNTPDCAWNNGPLKCKFGNKQNSLHNLDIKG